MLRKLWNLGVEEQIEARLPNSAHQTWVVMEARAVHDDLRMLALDFRQLFLLDIPTVPKEIFVVPVSQPIWPFLPAFCDRQRWNRALLWLFAIQWFQFCESTINVALPARVRKRRQERSSRN